MAGTLDVAPANLRARATPAMTMVVVDGVKTGTAQGVIVRTTAAPRWHAVITVARGGFTAQRAGITRGGP